MCLNYTPANVNQYTNLGLEDAAVPYEKVSQINVPALVINGAASYAFIAETARTLAAAFPQGKHVTLEGQTHEVANEVLAPLLAEFFAQGEAEWGK